MIEIMSNIKDLTDNEIENYKAKVMEDNGGTLDGVESIGITEHADGSIDISYTGDKFERIRRITGYLVGTVDRWNDAKKAELRDRVKHV